MKKEDIYEYYRTIYNREPTEEEIAAELKDGNAFDPEAWRNEFEAKHGRKPTMQEFLDVRDTTQAQHPRNSKQAKTKPRSENTDYEPKNANYTQTMVPKKKASRKKKIWLIVLGIILILVAGFSGWSYHQRYKNVLYGQVFKIKMSGEQTRYFTFGTHRKNERGKVFMVSETKYTGNETEGDNFASVWKQSESMAKTSNKPLNWNRDLMTPGTYTISGNKLQLAFHGTIYKFVFNKKDGSTLSGKATATGDHTSRLANEVLSDDPELEPDGHTFTNVNATFTPAQ